MIHANIICCIVSSEAKPFRKYIWTNPFFFLTLLLMIVYQIVLNWLLDDYSMNMLNLLSIPMYYRTEIFVVAVIDFFVTYFNEKILITCLNLYM
jgi:hypothetical protein